MFALIGFICFQDCGPGQPAAALWEGRMQVWGDAPTLRYFQDKQFSSAEYFFILTAYSYFKANNRNSFCHFVSSTQNDQPWIRKNIFTAWYKKLVGGCWQRWMCKYSNFWLMHPSFIYDLHHWHSVSLDTKKKQNKKPPPINRPNYPQQTSAKIRVLVHLH